MRTGLENLIDVGVLPPKIAKPFRDWVKSSSRDVELELRLLNAGENLEIAEIIGNDPLLVQAIRSKIEILARAIELINGKPPCTESDLERYNNENKTNLKFIEFKKNIISKWDLAVLNQVYAEYQELMYDQVESLTGVRPKKETDAIFSNPISQESPAVPEPGNS